MEGKSIEYKRELTKDVDNLEREVVAFLNTYGGHIIYGMDDDGTVYGVSDVDDTQKRIAQRLTENVKPACLGLFDIEVQTYGDKHVVRVIVSGGVERPYYIAKYGMCSKGCYYRVGSTCRQMPEKMIQDLFAKRTPRTLKNIPSPDQDLTFNQLRIYYEEKKRPLNDQFARNLDLLTPDGRYNFVAYLMSDNNHMSFKVAIYGGTDKVDLIESSEYGFCCLITATNKILDRLQTENRTWTRITSKYRIEKNMFEPVSVREAVINMIIHNDYSRGYTPLVEIFSDRLVLTSHGGLPEGMTEELFFKKVSCPRNREIIRIFHDIDMAEQLGSGMVRILREYDPSIFEIYDEAIMVTFKFVLGIDDDQAESPSEHDYVRDLQSTKPDLQSTKPDLQSTKPDLQSAKPDLQSAKPNLQSTEPNLQSTKSNLQSTKADLQSTNSNLQCTNPDLQSTSEAEEPQIQVRPFARKKVDRASVEIQILELIKDNARLTYEQIASKLDVSRAYVGRCMQHLVSAGIVRRVGSDKSGHWEIR